MRAVAVLSVVAFHLSRRAWPGGYLGVDVFFVLSGYLITAIIWRETLDGRFSIRHFYDRRVRRIMPALLMLLTVTTAASLIILLPSDLIGYCRSLLATMVFSANVYFWRDTNYFSTAAEQKPLLHLWSLGVEEQFYLFFPLVLAMTARWWRRHALTAIGFLTIGSLAADIVATFVGGAVPAFFLLPTRAWELGAGALLALLPAQMGPRDGRAEWIAGLGALAVALAMAFPLDTYGHVPVALPAVIGTALLILAGLRSSPIINQVLALRPVVFVGLVSYSLYLWHWPIIVFGQYYLVRPFSLMESVGAIGLMGACAVVSWRFVEQPFRASRIPMSRVRLGAAAGAFCLASVAALLIADGGMPSRLNADAAVINQAVDTNYRCPIQNYLPFGRSRACVMNLPSRNPSDADVVLLGNSHAQMYEPVWQSILSERGETGLLVPVNGCLPTVEINISLECMGIAQRNLEGVMGLKRARNVIVGLNWWLETDELVDTNGRPIHSDDEAIKRAVDDLIDRLIANGKQVVLIGPIAEPGWDVASILSRDLAFGHTVNRSLFLPKSEFDRRFGALIQHFQGRRDIGFARPDEVQCPGDRCYYVLDGHTLFADSNHLAAAELPRFRRGFADALAKTSQREP